MYGIAVYRVSWITLLIIGVILVLLGLPYFIHNYGCSGWCRGVAVNPMTLETYARLANFFNTDDTFRFFVPFGLTLLAVGVVLLYLYRSQRTESDKTQSMG